MPALQPGSGRFPVTIAVPPGASGQVFLRLEPSILAQVPAGT
jgi:hypothetical protein